MGLSPIDRMKGLLSTARTATGGWLKKVRSRIAMALIRAIEWRWRDWALQGLYAVVQDEDGTENRYGRLS